MRIIPSLQTLPSKMENEKINLHRKLIIYLNCDKVSICHQFLCCYYLVLSFLGNRITFDRYCNIVRFQLHHSPSLRLKSKIEIDDLTWLLALTWIPEFWSGYRYNDRQWAIEKVEKNLRMKKMFIKGIPCSTTFVFYSIYLFFCYDLTVFSV